MQADLVDLHVHSNFSDGTLTPSELVEYAAAKGLRAFALTDHDTAAGLPEALAAAGKRIEVVSGIEFSTEYQGKDIHIVGLDFDPADPFFAEQLTRFQDSRSLRNEKIIARMRADGIDISARQLREAYGEPVLTRAHFARYLMEHGYVARMEDAFLKFIGEDCKYYVPREKVTPVQAVRLIRRAGGIPVLAHPLLYHLTEAQMEELLTALKKAGLIGIEVLYSTHSKMEEQLVRALAKRHGLLPSGGSDFHGNNKPSIDLGSGRGNLRIPYAVLKNLRAART